jgi:hypothetical protein
MVNTFLRDEFGAHCSSKVTVKEFCDQRQRDCNCCPFCTVSGICRVNSILNPHYFTKENHENSKTE